MAESQPPMLARMRRNGGARPLLGGRQGGPPLWGTGEPFLTKLNIILAFDLADELRDLHPELKTSVRTQTFLLDQSFFQTCLWGESWMRMTLQSAKNVALPTVDRPHPICWRTKQNKMPEPHDQEERVLTGVLAGISISPPSPPAETSSLLGSAVSQLADWRLPSALLFPGLLGLGWNGALAPLGV